MGIRPDEAGTLKQGFSDADLKTVVANAQKLYVRFLFTDGGYFDLKLESEANAESVYRRTHLAWAAGKDVAIRQLDDEHHGGGWVNSDIAGIQLLSEAEILSESASVDRRALNASML